MLQNLAVFGERISETSRGGGSLTVGEGEGVETPCRNYTPGLILSINLINFSCRKFGAKIIKVSSDTCFGVANSIREGGDKSAIMAVMLIKSGRRFGAVLLRQGIVPEIETMAGL